MAGTTEEVLIPAGRMKWRKAALGICVSALVLAVVFKVSGDDRIVDGIRATPLGLWAACIPAFLLLHVASALKWRFYLRACGGAMPAFAAVRAHGAGLFANLCLPSLVGGDVLRSALATRHVRSLPVVVVAALLDRLADVFALVLLAFGGALASPQARSFLSGTGSIGAILLGATLAGIGAVALVVRALAKRPIRRFPRRIARRLVDVLRMLRHLRRRWRQVALGVAFSASLQSLFVALNWRLGAAMGFEMDVVLWFALWPLAKIAAMAPISFGGLGVREAAFAVLVSPFADHDLAVAESLVWQGVLVVGGLLCGVFFLATARVGSAPPDLTPRSRRRTP